MKYALDSLTGIRPTADLTIGNYIGAIKPLLSDEEAGSTSAVFVAELHAATTDPTKEIVVNSNELVRTLIASGIHGEVYSQLALKDVVSQTDMAIRGLTTAARLLRLPTLKDKAEDPEKANMALVMYPIAMAADIIMARPQFVPTGVDQLPHIEITKELIRSFNFRYGADLPHPAARRVEAINVLSLDNTGTKMSKSTPKGAIFLADNPDDIRRKIMKATTAPEPGSEMNQAVNNLTLIANSLGTDPDLLATVADLGERAKDGERVTGYLKEAVADVVVDFAVDLQERRASVTYADVRERLQEGNEHMRDVAQGTLRHIDQSQWGSSL